MRLLPLRRHLVRVRRYLHAVLRKVFVPVRLPAIDLLRRIRGPSVVQLLVRESRGLPLQFGMCRGQCRIWSQYSMLINMLYSLYHWQHVPIAQLSEVLRERSFTRMLVSWLISWLVG